MEQRTSVISKWQALLLVFVLNFFCIAGSLGARNAAGATSHQLAKKVAVRAFMQKAEVLYAARCAKKTVVASIENVDAKPAVKSVRYTQTQAHLRALKGIKNEESADYVALINSIFQDNFSYCSGFDSAYILNLLQEAACREEEHPGHYAFYHGYDGSWGVIYDLFKELRKWFYLDPDVNLVLRCQQGLFDQYKDINEFVDEWADRRYYSWWDQGAKGFRDRAICANLALFGNLHNPSSCTMNYFLGGGCSSYGSDQKSILESFCSRAGFTGAYLDELMELYKNLILPGGNHMLQFLVKKDVVDNVASLFGCALQPHGGKITSAYDSERCRHTDISSILELYCKDPEELVKCCPDMNYLQGRLFLNPAVFQDSSKVITYCYTASPISSANRIAYEQGLASIARRMVEAWVADHIGVMQPLFQRNIFGVVTNLEKLLASFSFPSLVSFGEEGFYAE